MKDNNNMAVKPTERRLESTLIGFKVTSYNKKERTCNVSVTIKNDIDDEGATALAHALKHNKSVKLLSLCDTKIGDVGAQALGNMLYENKTLEKLYLTNSYYKSNITQ